MVKNEINLDFERVERLGIEEAVFCVSKRAEQIEEILDQFSASGKRCLLTRLEREAFAEIPERHRVKIDYDETSRTAFYGWKAPVLPQTQVAVVSAGTSDMSVAKEAQRTLVYHDVGALPVSDVGVAGLWRLMKRVEELRKFPVIIAVAGMDAALPSVLGGLVPGLVIAVPTSVGYGATHGGHTALNSALVSCAPGIVVVNIDNGYGAACAALRFIRAQKMATN